MTQPPAEPIRLTLFVAACLLCTPALAANPTQRVWTIMDYADTQCHPAAELFPKTPTPSSFQEYLRSEGLAHTITERKCGGNAASVTISVTSPFRGLTYSVWFPSAGACDRFLGGESQGRANNDAFG
jgi:hypothetical protein